MSSPSFDTSELLILAGTFERSAGTVGAKAAVVVRKTALAVEGTSKQIAPVDTGNLRNSIGTDFTGDGRNTGMEAAVGPTAAYGKFLEYGTSRMSPRAFMGPALDRHAAAFQAALEQALQEGTAS